tara:strand:+ start:51 stop:719 length:669 start_codon:yes stop_codon:yes gene_type:complete
VVLNKMVERPGNDDIHKAFRLFDQGQKGKVDFDDLKQIATQASSKWVKSAYIGLEGGSIAELCSALAVAVMPLYLLTCWSLTAAQIGEQITDDEMREMVAEADRSGTGRVGAHVEGAVLVEPQLRPGGTPGLLSHSGSMLRRSGASGSLWRRSFRAFQHPGGARRLRAHRDELRAPLRRLRRGALESGPRTRRWFVADCSLLVGRCAFYFSTVSEIHLRFFL